jgi:hypothetical protein
LDFGRIEVAKYLFVPHYFNSMCLQICTQTQERIEADLKARTGYLFYDETRKRWVGRITFPDPTSGKRKEKKCYALTKTEARIKLEKIREKIKNQGAQVVANERMTFSQLAEEFRSKKLIPAVFVNRNKVAGMKNHYSPGIYQDVLVEHFGPKRLDAIEHSDIEAFKLKRLQTPTKHSVAVRPLPHRLAIRKYKDIKPARWMRGGKPLNELCAFTHSSAAPCQLPRDHWPLSRAIISLAGTVND